MIFNIFVLQMTKMILKQMEPR